MVTSVYAKKARIISIAIDPAYKCKGIGNALVNFTFNQLKTFYIRAVELEVRITNKEGIYFWKSFSFYPIKIISNYYHDGIDAIVMRKSLEN
jgi:ribosomal-protein-alanine N-acetyltransferase